jgi:hypothetical protein
MDSIKIIDDNSFTERPYLNNVQKIKKAKDIFDDPYFKRNLEKRSHMDKFSELFANLYPENSNRLPHRSAGIIKKFNKNTDSYPNDEDKFKNFFKKQKK